MKYMPALLVLFLLFRIPAQGQYNRQKLTDVLVANAWEVRSTPARPEKKMVFTRDQMVVVDRANGAAVAQSKEKWSLSSPDEIRWFLTVGSMTYEVIVSYTKSGTQYLKLTHQAGSDKITGYYEISLYATK